MVVVFAAKGPVFATSDWRHKRIDDGWTEIKRKLTDFTDHTWYGQHNEFRSTAGWIYYLRPGGNTGVLRGPDGRIYIDYRREGEDGRIFSLIKELRGGRQFCGNTLWRRDGLYLFTNPSGQVIHTWKWVEGNPEGFEVE